MRVPALAFASLLTAPSMGGCILDNPAFDDGPGVLSTASQGSGETDGQTDGATYGASLGDTADDTTSAGTSAGESAGTTTTDGTDTGISTDDTTADTDTAGSTEGTTTNGSGDSGSDSGDASDSEGSSETGAPPSVELKHYADGSCNSTFWCMNGGVPAVNLPVECFDSPMDPPYIVDRVGFQVYGTMGAAPSEIRIYEFDENTQRPVFAPLAEEWVGPIEGAGEHSIGIDPVLVSTPKVCVGLLSGDANTQLGIATNGVMPPPRRSFLGGDTEGPYCHVPTHTDVLAVAPGASTWCMSAWVRDE